MSNTRKAVLSLIVANIIWGAGAPIFKWALYSMHPFTLAFLRFIIPTLVLMFTENDKMKLKIRDMPNMLLAGIFAITLNIAFFFLGIQNTLSINAPIIGSSGPIFLLFASMFFLHEKMRLKNLLGNMLGLTGILLIVIEPLLKSANTGSLLGNIFLIFSMFTGVLGAIFSKKVIKKYNAISAIYFTFLIGSVTFFPFFVKEIMQYGFFPQITIASVIGVFFGSIFSSFIAYYCFFWGLKFLPASSTSVFSYIDPIASIFIAVPLLHEYPNALFMAGAFLVFFGIFIAEGRIHYHPIQKLFRTSQLRVYN